MGNISSARRDCDEGEDRISELPDDILLSIISPMRMEEAVKTSILSKRWRYLWAKRTHLHFNHLVLFPEIVPDAAIYLATTDQKTKYINWVNQVVGLHSSPCIDTFKVQFQLGNDAAHHIDKWVRFATLKKVKHLELRSYNQCNELYTIGFDILKPSPSPSPSPGDGDISFLMSLHLFGINISGDVLEFLLSRCPLLERLHVQVSLTLERLKISGPSYKLKQLTIISCHNLVELEIDAANLVSFYYYCTNNHSNFEFKSGPLLVEVAVGGYKLKSIMPRVLHVAGQLSKLSLTLTKCKIPGGYLPTLSYLQQLTLKLESDASLDLVAIKTLLESCPVVREFKIEFCWDDDELEMEADELKQLDLGDDELDGGDTEGEGEGELDLEANVHPNLKVLHVAGFIGCCGDVGLILYLVDFACNLETIICDSTRIFYDTHDTKFVEASRSRASKVAKIVPPKVRVEII